MKNVTKKLLFSVMVLVAALSLAVTSTFAWFTMNETADLQGFEVNLTAVDGILISIVASANPEVGADGTFKSYVSGADIEALLLSLYGEAALTHATTSGSISGGYEYIVPSGIAYNSADELSYTFRVFFRSNNAYDIRLDLGPVNDLAPLGPKNSRVTSVHGSDYIAIRAWDSITSAAYPFTAADAIMSGETVVVSGVSNDFTIDSGSIINARAMDAIRLAFDNGTVTQLWDPNPDTGFTDNIDGNLALDYYNHTMETSLTPVLAECTVDDTTVLVTLGTVDGFAGYNAYMDITIWLEGYDANAFNSILTDTITTVLKFRGTAI